MKHAPRTVFLLGLSLAVVPAWSASIGTGKERPRDGSVRAQAGSRLAQAPAPGPARSASPEQVAVPAAPRFDIERFDVQGNTLLEPAEVERALAPYSGKSKDFSDVQRALEALEGRYQRAGYGAVQVILPEQELERGVIVLRVIEPRLAKIAVEGNKFFDAENIRRSIPELKEGTTPNVVAMGQSSRLANENPAKRTTILLRAGANEGEVDATVRVQDEKFWRAGVSLDNTGSPTTGMYRLSFAYQHSNLFNLDHTLTFQYQLDPEPIDELDQLKVMGLAYRIPLYGLKSSIDLLAGYSDIGAASGQVIQGIAFNTSGSGTIFGARYNYTLPRIPGWQDYEHTISFGLDYKAFTNQVVEVQAGVAGENLTPDVTVYPLSITYNGSRRFENSEISFFGSGAHNIYPHGPDAYREKFYGPPGIGVRPGVGRPTYTAWRYGLNAVRALANDVQLRANITGQWSRDALVPGEQFGIGGWESLRGMREREAANDKGYRGTLEVYSPDLGGKLGLDGARL
ncbi:MAG: ShlB/FhaC/HecB family hemolysin secretion/activation protein, partial [Betaproteobacteria bacterium]